MWRIEEFWTSSDQESVSFAFKIKILDTLFYGDITGRKLYPGNIGIAQTRVVRIGLADVRIQRFLYNMMLENSNSALQVNDLFKRLCQKKALK